MTPLLELTAEDVVEFLIQELTRSLEMMSEEAEEAKEIGLTVTLGENVFTLVLGCCEIKPKGLLHVHFLAYPSNSDTQIATVDVKLSNTGRGGNFTTTLTMLKTQ
ncbi:hypothetical protein KBD87_01210 [Candidatus Saccharibacteria bacterium]|mgnify:CR=1 FL=1|nr:hypothetical protein [Candidatus Saccharibacteria bacterium]